MLGTVRNSKGKRHLGLERHVDVNDYVDYVNTSICVTLFTFIPNHACSRLQGKLKMRLYPREPEPGCQCENSLNRDQTKWRSARFVKLKGPNVTATQCTSISKENALSAAVSSK